MNKEINKNKYFSKKMSCIENKLTTFETEFIEIFGIDKFEKVYDFMQHNNILDFYKKAKNDANDLFNFGVSYGILTIVAFTYCHCKIKVDIFETINGYFKHVNSTTPETPETITENCQIKEVSRIGIPLIYNSHAKDGMVFATIDKYTKQRSQCIKYLTKMKQFSKYDIQTTKNNKNIFMYQIIDRYIEPYELLVCY